MQKKKKRRKDKNTKRKKEENVVDSIGASISHTFVFIELFFSEKAATKIS